MLETVKRAVLNVLRNTHNGTSIITTFDNIVQVEITRCNDITLSALNKIGYSFNTIYFHHTGKNVFDIIVNFKAV